MAFSGETWGKTKKYVGDQIATYLTSGSTPKGSWDASTNTPTLTDGTGKLGEYYDVVVAGKWNNIDFLVGDRVIYNSNSKWSRVPTGVEREESEEPIIVGYVSEKTTSLPTTRKSGKALKVGDYVKVLSTATLPFTIDGITFDSYSDEAEWNGTAYQIIDYSLGKTNEVGVFDKTKESISGSVDYQSDINEENVAQIKKVIQDGAFDKDTAKLSFTKYDNSKMEVELTDAVITDKTQTLTNKTISADNNTITELTGSNFKKQADAGKGKAWVTQDDGTFALGKAGSDTDNETIEEVSDKLQLKDKGIKFAKLNEDLVVESVRDKDTATDETLASEKAIRTELDKEATAREEMDTFLSRTIDTEITTRMDADTALQTNIDTESSNRVNADVALQENIDKKQDKLTAGTGISIDDNTITAKTKTLKVDTTEYDIKGDGTITLDTAIIKVSELPSSDIKEKCMYLLTLDWTEIGKYDTTDTDKYVVQQSGLSVEGTLVNWDTVNVNWDTYYPVMINDSDTGEIRRNQKADGTYVITYGSYTTKNGLYYYDNAWVKAGGTGGGEASSVQWGSIGGNLNNQTDVITKFNDMNATLELRKQEIETMQAQITEMLTNITNNTTDISDLKVDVPKKQDKEDSSLATTTKTVVGGINELKTKVDNLSSAVQYQGIVDSESALPTTAEVGDMYYVKNNSFFIYGNDKTWQSTGDSIDLTKLVNITDTQTIAGNKTFTGTTTTSNITTGTITTTDTANLTSGINLNSAGTISLSTTGIKNGSYTYALPTYAENSTLATQAEVGLKQDKLVSGTNIKKLKYGANSTETDILGSGTIELQHLYIHAFSFGQSNYMLIGAIIFNNNGTALGKSGLINWLTANGYTSINKCYCMTTGVAGVNTYYVASSSGGSPTTRAFINTIPSGLFASGSDLKCKTNFNGNITLDDTYYGLIEEKVIQIY